MGAAVTARAPDGVPASGGWYDGIEILRGLAAVSVMLFHCIGLLRWDVAGTALAPFRAGWIGVDLFFCISGFVITSALLKLRGKPRRGRVFWRARIARIAPLYIVTSAVFLLAIGSPAVAERPWFQLVTHALFVHNLFPDAAFSINGVTWSLGVEMQFYLLAFAVVPLAAPLAPRTLKIAILLVLAGVIACRAFVWFVLMREGASDAAINHALSQAPVLLEGFAFGALLAMVGPRQGSRLRAWTLSLLAMLLALAIWRIFDANVHTYWQSPAMAILFRSLVAAFAATAVLAALSAPARLSRAWRPLLHLGRISYGIYLWHLIVLTLVQRHLPVQGTIAVLVIIATTLVLSQISWRWVEQPFIAWARRASRRRPAPCLDAATRAAAESRGEMVSS